MAHRYNQRLERPHIPALNARNEIDVAALEGGPLETVIKYSGMKAGDKVTPRWVGMSITGEAFDDIQAEIPIQDEVNGVVVSIDHAHLRNIEGGWAFYSYTMNNDQSSEESLRQFCFIGLRASGDAQLPPVLGLTAHGLVIRAEEMGTSEDAHFVIAPYQAMQPRDRIAWTLTGFEDGEEFDDESGSITVEPEHLSGKALRFSVRKNFFRMFEPGTAQATYAVELAEGETIDGPPQTFIVDSHADAPDYLPAPAIEGHEPGDELDPARYRNGLTIRVQAYPGMSDGDRVVLDWRSPGGDVLQTVRADPSTLGAEAIIFQLPAKYVLDSQGSNVTLTYLYAREGESLRSDSLEVSIKSLRELDAPLVIGAVADGNDSGVLPAIEGIDGVYVDVPVSASPEPDESVEVHWHGVEEFGRFIAEKPIDGNPQRYLIPKQYVAANMGKGNKDESRRFEVFYLMQPGAQRSDAYSLRITPLVGGYPALTCLDVEPGTDLLSRGSHSAGARLSLETWRFIAPGQVLRLSVTGVDEQGGALEEMLRDGVLVNEDEAKDGVKETLPAAVMNRLKLNEQFTLHAHLSFDGGRYFRAFSTSRVTLTD